MGYTYANLPATFDALD